MSVLPVCFKFFFAHYLSAKASLKSECIEQFREKRHFCIMALNNFLEIEKLLFTFLAGRSSVTFLDCSVLRLIGRYVADVNKLVFESYLAWLFTLKKNNKSNH